MITKALLSRIYFYLIPALLIAIAVTIIIGIAIKSAAKYIRYAKVISAACVFVIISIYTIMMRKNTKALFGSRKLVVEKTKKPKIMNMLVFALMPVLCVYIVLSLIGVGEMVVDIIYSALSTIVALAVLYLNYKIHKFVSKNSRMSKQRPPSQQLINMPVDEIAKPPGHQPSKSRVWTPNGDGQEAKNNIRPTGQIFRIALRPNK